MENNEIYIDGVNVAGCQCFENDKCLWSKKYYESNLTPNCEEVKDCYFKQLRRLEQENEFLQQEIFHITTGCRDYTCYTFLGKDIKYWQQLQKENEDWHIKYAGCNTANKAIQEENKQYRSALEEIRDYLYTLTTVDSDFVNTETYLRINDKINEVLNENK